ncbi:hypothetical protein GYMLUDRAFT_64148 [Collybiopsis luxurians FD-317 M1]|uniref:Anaphase-promoting complex subunit 4 WD40 domain-containing protein n=1 Tax=Collybiopsis luxurians FD-317 M1 TaxID=944289 RepID=A0A0D0BDL7_9AGAR|nr:hypothetical protein GYMLUDRAFT_64148 [Collybiopsis luxurians FD-317 M1]
MTMSYTLLMTITTATDGINSLSFTSDGRYLASASNDKVVRIFDLERKFTTAWEFKGLSEFTSVAWIGWDLLAGFIDGDLLLFSSIGHWIFRPQQQVFHEFFVPIVLIQISQLGSQILIHSGSDIAVLGKNGNLILTLEGECRSQA